METDCVDIYASLCAALLQLEEANKVIKHYAFENVKSVEQWGSEEPREIEYPAANDPAPALEYLKKYGVKND